MKRLFIFIMLLLLPIFASAQVQNDTSDIFNLSLAQLIKYKIHAVTFDSVCAANIAPYIITVITHQEIVNSGASDLMDLLKLIPGIDFGTDVVGQVGLFMQGMWAHEGKALLLIDGHVMNEPMYGTLQFGNHYPIQDIEKIEIIRGSGSVLYGNFAELLVINIITKKSYNNQINAGSNIGISPKKNPFLQNYFISTDQNYKNAHIHLFTRYSASFRSDKIYHDIYNNSFPLTLNRLNDFFLNLNLNYKKLDLSFLYDKYNTTSKDYFGKNLSIPYPKNFTTASILAKYYTNLSKKLNLLLIANYKYSQPWTSPLPKLNPFDSSYYQLIQGIHTLSSKTILSYRYLNKCHLSVGAELYYNHAVNFTSNPINNFWNQKPFATLWTFSSFLDYNYNFHHNYFSLGARYELSPLYGAAFVPRASYVYKFSSGSIKIIFNRSYRSPTIANLTYNFPLAAKGIFAPIRPEITNIINSQFSFLLSNNLYLALSTFYNYTKNPIAYFVDSLNHEGYVNINAISTTGFDAQIKFKNQNLFTYLSFSLYYPTTHSKLLIYSLPDIYSAYIGASNYKITFYMLGNILNSSFLNIQLIYFGPKYGYDTFNPKTHDLYLKKFPPTLLLNSSFSFKIQKFYLNFGVNNILDQNYYLIQAYKGWHPPLLDKGRIIHFQISYKF